MTTLVFDEELTGHHLEYLHHYYQGTFAHPNDFFIFVVSSQFINHKSKFSWMPSSNVEFVMLNDIDVAKCKHKNVYIEAIKKAYFISRCAKRYNADRVVLTMLMRVVPFIIFFLPRKVRLRGIIYQIYLYSRSYDKKYRVIIDEIRYWLMARCNAMEKIFILNDAKSAETLNNIYKTNKFKFLPDPVPEIDESRLQNIRQNIGVDATDYVFLHFGGMARRKGTIEILESISCIEDNQLVGKTFIFAGIINEEIKEKFYKLLASVKEKAHIIVFDEFCSYDFLNNLCYSSNAILIPYKITKISSGVLGYAAVFKKPLIGPSDGLIGNLIKKYGLGVCMPDVSKESIMPNIINPPSEISTYYSRVNNVTNFYTAIFS